MQERREFFKAFKKPFEKEKEAVIRPPYCIDEKLFLEICPTCETKDCEKVCEENIIIIKADGTPTLNFIKGGCTFCEECAKKCQLKVLDLEKAVFKDKINASFFIIAKDCMAHNKTICFSCKEPCIDDAILFNGLFNPVIDPQKCTGCGFCLSRCPTNAISYQPIIIKEVQE